MIPQLRSWPTRCENSLTGQTTSRNCLQRS